MKFIERFPYVIKYKKSNTNIVVDALSRRHALFSKLGAQILGFENIPELYKEDQDFALVLLSANIEHKEDFIFLRGTYLKKENFIYLKEHIKNSF